MNLGVIAEYNPFHNGHAYHLARSRELSGADGAVVVMSGDFVQRGEPAMFDKRTRAMWALQNGADMVLSLPAPFSLSCAELFALAGVKLLRATGLVDVLCFGSERGDADSLIRAAALLDEEPPEVGAAIRGGLSRGLSYPRARAEAYRGRDDGVAKLLSGPNDVLALEYVRAINNCAPGMRPLPIPRHGPGHDSPGTGGRYASASAIRGRIAAGRLREVSEPLPGPVYEDIREAIDEGRAPISMEGLSREVIYALRRMDKRRLAALPDVSEGLENVLYAACREQASLDGLLRAAKSRRYTLARLKRICMRALLGFEEEPRSLLDGLYIRVLGVRRDSMGLLSELCEKSTLPVIVRHADLDKLTPAQRRLHDMDMLASDIAPLGGPWPLPVKPDYAYPLLTM